MLTRPRKKFHEDVITFPATKTAGELTIDSDPVYDFASAPSVVSAQLIADDASDITDTLTVNLKVSYDGDTYYTAAAYTDLANGSGAISAYKADAVSFAPYVKVSGVFDGSGALAEGHGCKVNLELEEDPNFYRHTINDSVVTVPTTVAADTTTSGTAVSEITDTVFKVLAIVTSDASKLTDTTAMIQSSYDGSSWWDVLDSATDISSANFVEIPATDNLGNYFRVNLITAAGTGEIAEDHSIEVKLIVLSS